MTINADQSGVLKCVESNIVFLFDRYGLKNKSSTLNINDIVSFDSYKNQNGTLVANNILKTLKEYQIPKSKDQTLNSHNRCLAKIKNFNKLKGFGFVQCQTQLKTEAFIHISELFKANINAFDVGDYIMVSLKENQKGKCVFNIARPTERDFILNTNEQELNKTEEMKRVLACVKFYDKNKKFGFLSCQNNDHSTDAYISEAELLKANISDINKGDYLMVRIRDGYKGKQSAYDIKKPLPKDLHLNDRKLDESEIVDHKSEVQSSCDNFKNKHLESYLDYDESIKITKKSFKTNSIDEEIKPETSLKNHETDCNKAEKTKCVKPISGVIQTKITDFAINEEGRKIQAELIQKKKCLEKAKKLNIPDGTSRIQMKIKELEEKFEKIKLKQLQIKSENKINLVKKEIATHDKCEETFRRSLENMKQSINSKGDAPNVKIKNDFSAREKVNEDFRRSLEKLKISGNDRGEAHSDKNKFKFDSEGFFFSGKESFSSVTKEALEKLFKSLKTCPPATTEIQDPDGFVEIKLMKHQRQALAWLKWRESQDVSGGILADDMGLGKTLTMIALILLQNTASYPKKEEHFLCEKENSISNLNEDNKEISKQLIKTNSTLIVAPASLIYHWKDEIMNRCKSGLLSIHLFHGPRREKDPKKLTEFDIVITTYDIIRRSNTQKDEKTKTKMFKDKTDTLFDIEWRRLILDEAHQIKNFKSKQSVACCEIHSISKWAMTGTPIQNSETDFFAFLRFLNCSPFNDPRTWKKDVATGTKLANKRMQTLVSCFVLRRTKAQKDADGKALVSLPPRQFKIHEIELDLYEKQVYQKLKSKSKSSMQKYVKKDESEDNKLTVSHLLVLLLRLRQCCCHLSLLKDVVDPDILEKDKSEVAFEDLFSSMSIGKEKSSSSSLFGAMTDLDKNNKFEKSYMSSKIKLMINLLSKIKRKSPTDKCVIISQWTKFLSIVEHHLSEAGISFASINGSVTASKRMDLVNEFNHNPVKPKVMLVSLQAGGVGLNLVGANHLMMLDLHWNPALEQQAFDRIYRVGQKKEVFVHKFVVQNSVEESILKLQNRKQNLANLLMEGATADKKKRKLTIDDLKSLFGLN